MTMHHVGEGTALWYRAFRYLWLERQIVSRPDVRRILDLGCGGGENLGRLASSGGVAIGLDVDHERLRRAREVGPVLLGDGTRLPCADASIDLVYAAHVLHHVSQPRGLLDEARRVLRPGGLLLLAETVENHPLIHLGRSAHPWWHGDAVETRLRYADLLQLVREAGFEQRESGQYSVLFWLWEILPERFALLDWLTPAFTALEVVLNPLAHRWAAHAYCLAERATA